MSSVTTAKAAPKAKTTTISKSTARVQLISDLVQKELSSPRFPALKNIPNIHYVVMAVFASEVNDLRLLRTIGGRLTSRHYTPTNAKDSSFIRKGYTSSINYRTLSSKPGLDPTIKYNLDDGRNAHGITAAMGCYFIKDTNANKELKQLGYGGVINAYANMGIPLEINLGESMTSLFTTSDAEKNLIASIAQGLIILNKHYIAAPKKTDGTSLSSFERLLVAVGTYVGTGRDASGYTGSQRIIDVKNLANTKISILANNNIQPMDKTYFESVRTDILGKAFNGKKLPSGSTSSTTKVATTTKVVSPTEINC